MKPVIYLSLFISFFRIGLFSFGGGYAMIPLIQKEIELNSWLTAQQFVDILAIAESTPGPIAINSATYVGFKVAGFLGAFVSTLGVCLPAFFLVVVLTKMTERYKDHPVLKGFLFGVRPVVISLVSLAALFVGQTVLTAPTGFLGIDWLSFLIAALGFMALLKFKAHPILLICLSGLAGIFFY